MLAFIDKLRCGITRGQLMTVLIFPAAAIIGAFIIRLQSGSPVMFFMCFGDIGIFPGRGLYYLALLLRLVVCGTAAGAAAVLPGFMGLRLRALCVSLAAVVAVLFEFKLLFFCRSLLIVCIMQLLTGAFLFKIAIDCLRYAARRTEWVILSIAGGLLQILMALAVLSLIV